MHTDIGADQDRELATRGHEAAHVPSRPGQGVPWSWCEALHRHGASRVLLYTNSKFTLTAAYSAMHMEAAKCCHSVLEQLGAAQIESTTYHDRMKPKKKARPRPLPATSLSKIKEDSNKGVSQTAQPHHKVSPVAATHLTSTLRPADSPFALSHGTVLYCQRIQSCVCRSMPKMLRARRCLNCISHTIIKPSQAMKMQSWMRKVSS